MRNGKVVSVIASKEFKTDTVILAIGHSARETYFKILEKNINVEAKPMAVGIRIMHPQEMIKNIYRKK